MGGARRRGRAHKHGESVYAFKLYLARQSGDRWELADSIDEEETASLTRLGEGITRASERAAGIRREPRAATSVLACPSCGAPQELRNVDHVFCGACGTRVAISEEVRERIAASIADDPSLQRKLRDLIEQPGAGRANALIGTFAVCAVACVGYSIWAASVPAVMCSASPLFVVYALAARETARRAALRKVAASFAATPVGGGGALACRRCGAPLSDAGEHVLVSCRFCATANLVAVGLDCELTDLEDERAEIEEVAARRFTATVLVGAAVALAVTAIVAAHIAYPAFVPWRAHH